MKAKVYLSHNCETHKKELRYEKNEKCCDAENTQLLMELLSVSGEKFSSGKEALHHAIAELEARSV